MCPQESRAEAADTRSGTDREGRGTEFCIARIEHEVLTALVLGRHLWRARTQDMRFAAALARKLTSHHNAKVFFLGS